MKFCKTCRNKLTKNTIPPGRIVFQCHICVNIIEGDDDDTLMFQANNYEAQENHKHLVFFENAPFDDAGNIVLIDCNKCKRKYMTLVRTGNYPTLVCKCGNRTQYSKYVNSIKK